MHSIREDFSLILWKERETERERDRQTDRQRQRERERERDFDALYHSVPKSSSFYFTIFQFLNPIKRSSL